MRRGGFDRSLAVWLLFLLIVITASTWLSYGSLINILRNDERVNLSQTVMDELDATLSTLKDAETGQRGFLLTGEEAYLAPYDSWSNRIAVHRFVQDIPLKPSDPAYEIVSGVEKTLHRFRDVPMLICWGEQDFVFDQHFLDEWRRRFPRAEVHAFADAGHYILATVSGTQCLFQLAHTSVPTINNGTNGWRWSGSGGAGTSSGAFNKTYPVADPGVSSHYAYSTNGVGVAIKR